LAAIGQQAPERVCRFALLLAVAVGWTSPVAVKSNLDLTHCSG
jgi:hypothetical protein